MLAREHLALVSDFADIEAIAQESGERPTGERDASNGSSIRERAELGFDASPPQVSEKMVQAAEFQVASEDMADRFGLGRNDCDLSVLGLVAQGNHSADPKAFAFGGADLVADTLGGDLPLELGKRQQDIER